MKFPRPRKCVTCGHYWLAHRTPDTSCNKKDGCEGFVRAG